MVIRDNHEYGDYWIANVCVMKISLELLMNVCL